METENRQRRDLLDGSTVLGIELGSTRIKAVLLDSRRQVLATSGHEWENHLENGVWTYPLAEVWAGLQDCYAKLCEACVQVCGVRPARFGAVGVSAMMHGYLVFDEAGRQLAPFRTWRNTMTEQAAAELSARFCFNIPQRWSIAHLYQSMLRGEPHVADVRFMTTLSGYVHWQLTGEKVLGVGDASGMFPIAAGQAAYDPAMLRSFDELAAQKGYRWKTSELLPKVLRAGEKAGVLTAVGAKLLDPTGGLEPGIPFCPPEGDAGTGMVATDSVAPRTGNVSAGTSIFAMAVLERPLRGVYPEIDMVTTPDGAPVAMVHCNNCTTDFDAWTKLFGQLLAAAGCPADKPRLYDLLYSKALAGEPDCGGLLSCNYHSGEHITRFQQGRPFVVRTPDSRLTLENFARCLLDSALCTLRIGMDILFDKEQVALDRLCGHGGLFKTAGAGQRLMAAALRSPVIVLSTAGEGGAWGAALLADFLISRQPGETLERYLDERVFAGDTGCAVMPDPAEALGFETYLARFVRGLAIERAAVTALAEPAGGGN